MATTPETSISARAKYEPVIGLEVHVQLTASALAPRILEIRRIPMSVPYAWACPGALPVNRRAVG